MSFYSVYILRYFNIEANKVCRIYYWNCTQNDVFLSGRFDVIFFNVFTLTTGNIHYIRFIWSQCYINHSHGQIYILS